MDPMVRTVLDVPHARTRMSWPERDEHSTGAPSAPRELEHERKRALGRRSVEQGQVELGATSELGPVRPDRLAGQRA
jgi:hypothetical protein